MPGSALIPALSAVLALVMTLVAGCSLVPLGWLSDRATEPSDGSAERTVAGLNESPQWWKTFDDPILNRVVEAVLDSNFDLAAGMARVEQARAGARIAVAARFPMVQASLGATQFDAPTNAGLGAQLDELGLGSDVFSAFGFALPDRLDQTTYSVGADFAYEVDVWGRNRNAALAAGAERSASEADFRAVRMGVLAQTVGTYLEIVDLKHQRHLAGELVDILGEWESLAADRYDRGVADIRNLYAVRRNLRDAEAALPGIDGRLADAEGRLKVLLGGELREDLMDTLPEAMSPAAVAPVPVGIRAELLAQRPDVSAARQRLAAARFALDTRRAALLPSLSLAGSVGLQSSEATDWFDPEQWFKNLRSNLLAPVFQGGRLRGNVALAEATLDEATAAYGRAVVTAATEVEATLTGLESSQRRAALLSSFADEAGAEATLQEQRYVSGVGDYATFLAASQIHVGAKSALAAGERDLAYARLALHRALGGTWATVGEPASVRQGGPSPGLRMANAESSLTQWEDSKGL